MEKREINPWLWQNNLGFNQAIEVKFSNQHLYVSGQTAMDETGNPVGLNDMAKQIEKSLDNLQIVLEQSGYGLDHIVRLNYYTTNVQEFFKHYALVINRIGPEAKFSCTLLGVKELAFPELMIEIEATAMK